MENVSERLRGRQSPLPRRGAECLPVDHKPSAGI